MPKTLPRAATRLPLAALLAASLGACATVPADAPVAAAPAPIASAAPAQPAKREALYALFARADAEFVARNPVQAFFRGDFSRADTLGEPFAADNLLKERAAALANLAALRAIGRDGLSDTDQVAYDVFAYNQERVIAGTEAGILDYERLLPIDHFNGLHLNYPRLSNASGIMPFATVADYENALKRHAQMPAIFDAGIARMREGMAAGIVQPRLTVELMISQLDTQIATATAESPYYLPVANFPDTVPAAERARLEAAYRTAIETQLRPTLVKLRDFLAKEYLPAARAGIGLNTAAGGDAYYRFRVAEITTLPLTAEEVHQTGLAEVARINAALAQARAEAGDRKPVIYRDKAALTKAWYDIAARVEPRLPALFARQPKTPLEIRPYEEFREAYNLAASYSSGNLETGKPGVFYFSGYNLANRSVSPTVALYLHEGAPGHHFQNMIAQENAELPDFLRYGGFGAYGEGWGLYAESLGYEMGLYDDPLDRIGALAGGELLRAVRLVVDTGIHSMGWTREQAVEYMIANGQPRDFALSETARYTVMPGQALAYKVGELTIKRLRKKAEDALGAKFDVRDFHAQVLDTADLPLSVLEAKIDRWIARGGGR